MESKPNMPDLRDLRLFDSCVTLGRFSGVCIPSADELLRIMDKYCIEEALVHDYHARSVVPVIKGNRRALGEASKSKRLHPVWVLEPPEPSSPEACGRMVSEMLDSGARAARLCMRRMGCVPWFWDGLLDCLEARRAPAFLDFGDNASTRGELGDYDVDSIYQMASRRPHLPVILSHIKGGLRIHPAVLPMMRRLPNVYLDISGVQIYWRYAALGIGADRVLFASGMPFTDPGILVSNIQYHHELDLQAKKLVCGDNLRRLLGGVS